MYRWIIFLKLCKITHELWLATSGSAGSFSDSLRLEKFISYKLLPIPEIWSAPSSILHHGHIRYLRPILTHTINLPKGSQKSQCEITKKRTHEVGWWWMSTPSNGLKSRNPCWPSMGRTCHGTRDGYVGLDWLNMDEVSLIIDFFQKR